MANVLSEEGARLLAYLQTRFETVSVYDLGSFPTYRNVHEALGLQQIGKTWGESLDPQGMADLAQWAFDHEYPAVTGMIVDKTEKRPGKGYFQLYGKDPSADLQWWLDEVRAATAFDWRSAEHPNDLVAGYSGEGLSRLEMSAAKTLGDLLQPGSRLFLKSEWGPVSSYWPALSFSKRSVGEYLNQEYVPGRDFVVYAGTGNGQRTREQDFRKRLLSVLAIETGQPLATEELVPWESWQRELKDHGKVWPLSFGVRQAWSCDDLPWAHDVVPTAYRALGFRSNWGGVVEVESSEERAALAALVVSLIDLPPTDKLRRESGKRDRLRQILADPARNRALARMEDLIKGRLGPGRAVMRQLPPRVLPPGTDLFLLLEKKLREQGNLCLLCGRELRLDTSKKLLQCSPDRIDSKNPSYGEENLQITHLACNLAKNDGTAADFEEWLQLLRGVASE